MNRVIELLQASHRPMILLGAGARDAAPEIIAFAELWQIPMETTWAAVDLVPYAHPLFVGRLGITATRGSNRAIQSCDLLLSIGARLDQPTIAYDYDKFAPKAKKILVDIDEGERLKIPNLDLFIHQDAGEFIKELLNEENVYVETPPIWWNQCLEWKKDRLEGTTTTYQMMNILSEQLPNDAILVVGSSTTLVNIFCAGFRNKAGQRFIQTSSGLGSMGGSIPVAIGAALASGKPITVVDGDGSFMQNIQELEVVRRLNLPIKFYVFCNGGYLSIHNSEMRAFGRAVDGETIPDPQQIARAFGVEIIKVNTPKDEQLIPRVMFDGRGNLGDMWPYEQH